MSGWNGRSYDGGGGNGARRKGRAQRRPVWRVGKDLEYPPAPYPLCITLPAMAELLRILGRLPPETGAKGFGPKDFMGIDVIEFDVHGSWHGRDDMYTPDSAWGQERCEYHLNQPEDQVRLWTADLHTHPGRSGVPSARVGDGLGDLGYVEKVMAENEWIKEFWLPILTQTGPNEVTIYPWLCRRGEPLSVYLAEEIWVCDVSEFPVRRFNPAWERAVTASAQRETDVPGTTLKEDPVADPADFEGRNGSQTTEVVLPVGEFRFDPEAFKNLVDGTLVGWEQDRTGQQLLRVDHPEGVRL